MGQYPWLIITICIVVASGLSVGFVNLKVENRTDRLYIPQESQALKEIEKGSKHFHDVDTREETVILVPEAVENAFSFECLTEAYSVHKAIISLKSFTEFCATQSGVTANSTNECMTLNFLEFFNYSKENMVNIHDKITEKQNSAEAMSNGRPSFYNFGRMFGKIRTNSSNGKLKGPEAIQMIYFMRNPTDDKKNLKIVEWEKSFEDKVSTFKNNLKCFSLFYAADSSLDDAISESSGSDIVLISITFTIMISFSSVMLGKFRNPLMGHSLLSNAGIFAVVFGVMAGFGLCLFVGIPFVSMNGVLPFLILGIGIDDMFIIMDELDRQDPELTVVQTIKSVLVHSGATVTMTTITDLVAFAVSTSTAFPAVRYFCIFAAVSITLSYLFMITFFVAFMTFEIRRMKSGRRECLPLCRVPEVSLDQPTWYQPQMSQFSNKAMKVWGEFLMLTPTRIMVVILSLGLLASGILGMLNIEEEFNRTILAKDNSHFREFINVQEKYFSSGTDVSVVLDSDIQYDNPTVQNDIIELSEVICKNSFYKNKSISWLADLQKFVQNANASRNLNQVQPPESNTTYRMTYLGNSSIAPNETVIKYAFLEKIMTSLNITSSRITIKDVTRNPINITFAVLGVLKDNFTARFYRALEENKLILHVNQINMTAEGVELIHGNSVPQAKPNLSPMSLSGSSFLPTLKQFLNFPSFSHHTANVKLSKDGYSIAASRVTVFMKSSTSSIFQRDAMLSIREDIETKSSLPAYAVAKAFKYFEQYAITLKETIRNLTIAAATILLITWPFLADVRATLLVFLGFAALAVELFALMYIWKVTLNVVSMINLVMAIGFSVDYSAHLGHAFVTSQEETPEERVVFALETIGASVLMGGEIA